MGRGFSHAMSVDKGLLLQATRVNLRPRRPDHQTIYMK